MMKLDHATLYSLEEYDRIRPEFRKNVIEHKKQRRVNLGKHAALYFEDQMTMQYQVQEMLRIERIYESQGIQDELDVYNPLIPDGSNWKATFMIEYNDVEERKMALNRFIGIEETLWVRVEGFEKVFAIANEDLDRTTEDKTSAVHFVRFELTDAMVAAVKQGKAIETGIDHAEYACISQVEESVRQSLCSDLH